MQAWEAHDPTLTRPIAAPLEQCAELLSVDLDAIREAAAHVAVDEADRPLGPEQRVRNIPPMIKPMLTMRVRWLARPGSNV